MPALLPDPDPDVARAAAVHAVSAFDGAALVVISGANAGDPLPAPLASVCGDYYRLTPGAAAVTLALDLGAEGTSGRLAEGSTLGPAGAEVVLEGRLSLMAPDGDLVEALVVALGGRRAVLPLSPLLHRHVYTLIAVDARPGPIRLADVVAGAFARGTRIALADGRQVPVEDLTPGDEVITRDHGARPLRWRGAVQLRAEGGFAPVVVQPGVMGNPHALVVSPHHRLFLYRRAARALAGAADLLVQARYLVDGRAILRREGGIVEYFSLVFDNHEVVYAEGVPCESLLVCPSVLTRLPEDLAVPLRAAFPGLSQPAHAGSDRGATLPEALVSRLRDRPGVTG